MLHAYLLCRQLEALLRLTVARDRLVDAKRAEPPLLALSSRLGARAWPTRLTAAARVLIGTRVGEAAAYTLNEVRARQTFLRLEDLHKELLVQPLNNAPMHVLLVEVSEVGEWLAEPEALPAIGINIESRLRKLKYVEDELAKFF